jgi:putative ABC transport system ATP-binding protein
MTAPALLSVKGLVKTYTLGETEVHALRGVDLEIQRGEFVAVGGPSGSGKSTLMNILGCLDVPDAGEYRLDGETVQNLGPDQLSHLRNRKLGFVFQSFNLLARTTALENVELPLLYRREISPAEAKAKAMESLAKVGLAERAGHYPNQLSGGQQQRVAIARSMVNDPVLIFADEPTGNLDTRTSLEIMEVFQNLNQRGITIMLVTHEPDIATFAGRQVVVRDGRITRDEPTPHVASAREALAALTAMGSPDLTNAQSPGAVIQPQKVG